MIARGNVVLTQANSRIAADSAEFNIRTRLGTFYRASGIANVQPPRQTPQPGIVVPTQAGQETDIYFFGETVEKIGARKYKITNGGFSTCVQPTPRWDLSAETVILYVDHYTLLRQAILNANAGLPGMDGTLRFHHVNYVVTDLDEMMAGKNHLERRGWPKSEWGIGRHRIASALFCYFPCPAGGEAEYGADSDALDDNWIPRDFSPMFGIAHWMHDLPGFLRDGAEWDVTFAADGVPTKGGIQPHSDL